MPAWYQGAPVRFSQAGYSRRVAGHGEPLPLDTPLLSVPSSLYTSPGQDTALLYTSPGQDTTLLYTSGGEEEATWL